MIDIMNGHTAWMGGMWFFGILFWVLVIVGAAVIVKWLSDRGRNESPLDILKRRYARGEIDRETFERMKKDLEGYS